MYLGRVDSYACVSSTLHRVRRFVAGDAVTATTSVNDRTGREGFERHYEFSPKLLAESAVLPEHTAFLVKEANTFEVADE